MTPKQVARFWAKVDKSGECWIWTGYRNARGYGKASNNGKIVLAHRLAWEIMHGPIPPGKQVCHDCPGGDNPSCVRHLWLGTTQENMADRHAKGRYHRADGSASAGNGKLTPNQVREIRAIYAAGRYGIGSRLAREYGVSHAAISRIVHRHDWQHI